MGNSASSEQPSDDPEGSLDSSSNPSRAYSYPQDASLALSSTSSSALSSQQPPALPRQAHPTAHRASSASLTHTPHGLRPSGSVALAPVLSKQTSTASASKMGQNQSRHGSSGAHGVSSPAAKPVAIPDSQGGAKKSHQSQQSHPARQPDERLLPIIPIGPPAGEPNSYLLPEPEYARPPRLPLPIEPIANEVDIEGSPILSAANLGLENVPIPPTDESGFPLVSRASELSSTTVDDDDIGDDLGTVRGGVLPSVPTVIEWFEPGTKVYVTGTFADWDRKYRLTKNGPSKNKDALSTTINLQPGTYHLRFIVDGDMILSKNLPTAVDFTNSLVNYIEVVPKETTATAGAQTLMPPELQTQPHAPQVVDLQTAVPQPVHPAVVSLQLQQESRTPTLPPTPSIAPLEGGTPVPPASETPTQRPDVRKAAAAAAAAASHPVRYTTHIPIFLRDSDAHESSQEFRRSLALSESLPQPPSLPMFLNKSILNGSMPMKDDASVLILPNHTVLNHLATTSIRSGVLATSATTRYKRKFLTTIMYKPTDAED